METHTEKVAHFFMAWLLGIAVLTVIVTAGYLIGALIMAVFGISVATAVGVFVGGSLLIAAAMYKALWTPL